MAKYRENGGNVREEGCSTYPHADHKLGPIHEWEIDGVCFLCIGKRGGIGVHPIIDSPIIADECFIHQEPENQHELISRYSRAKKEVEEIGK